MFKHPAMLKAVKNAAEIKIGLFSQINDLHVSSHINSRLNLFFSSSIAEAVLVSRS